MSFHVVIKKQAQKQLKSLDKKSAKLIASYILKNLEGSQNPCALPESKKLQGTDNGWRWRVGSYRVLGTVNGTELVIELFRTGNRQDVYRKP